MHYIVSLKCQVLASIPRKFIKKILSSNLIHWSVLSGGSSSHIADMPVRWPLVGILSSYSVSFSPPNRRSILLPMHLL